MTRDTFEELLLRHGSDLSRWPEAERHAAEALLAGDRQARHALAEAARLDALVRLAVSPVPDEALAARIAGVARAERAAFALTTGRIGALLAASLGLGGLGYAAASMLTGLIAPGGLATGFVGAFGVL